jgi:hypothetical protein
MKQCQGRVVVVEETNFKTKEEMVRTNFGVVTGLNLI